MNENELLKIGQCVYFLMKFGSMEYPECGVVRNSYVDAEGVCMAYVETMYSDCYESEFVTLPASTLHMPNSEAGREIADEYHKVSKYGSRSDGWNCLEYATPAPGRCVVGLKSSLDGAWDAVVCTSAELAARECRYWMYVPDFNGMMVAPDQTDVF